MPRPHPSRQATNRARQSAGRRLLPRGLLVALRETGVDTESIAASVGLGAADLAGPLPSGSVEKFLARAAASVPPWFGLTLGSDVRPELWGVVGLAAMSSPTFGAALAHMARYKRLVTGDEMEIAAGDGTTAIRFRLADPESRDARPRLDAELAFILGLGRTLTRVDLRPVRVAVELTRPAYHDRYASLFGCPVRFAQPVTELVFRDADLARPLVSANRELADVLAGPAADLLARAGDATDAAGRARLAIRSALHGGMPDIAEIARSLKMSERSLQRRLREQGTSFQQLVDQVRASMAQRYLRDPALQLAEISFLLGFAHPNSFFRAFKRWTGRTPQAYRREQT